MLLRRISVCCCFGTIEFNVCVLFSVPLSFYLFVYFVIHLVDTTFILQCHKPSTNKQKKKGMKSKIIFFFEYFLYCFNNKGKKKKISLASTLDLLLKISLLFFFDRNFRTKLFSGNSHENVYYSSWSIIMLVTPFIFSIFIL